MFRHGFDESDPNGDNKRVASLQHVGLWRSWERASMAWKRSSVRSRSGPPSYPFPNHRLISKSFPQASCDLVSIGVNFASTFFRQRAGKHDCIH
jgi:hypothetical protein